MHAAAFISANDSMWDFFKRHPMKEWPAGESVRREKLPAQEMPNPASMRRGPE